jgi:hypothetical protein
MALARIITRSQPCARQLALDLLARGYAVEIVSPDKIPDNLADLELRVDAGPGDQLIANVESHDGDRSASLDFVHHLKAPMIDFIRRPLQSAGSTGIIEVPISFDGEAGFDDVEVPAAILPLEPVRFSLAARVLQQADSVVEEPTTPPMPEAVVSPGEVGDSAARVELDNRSSVAESIVEAALIAQIPIDETKIEPSPIEQEMMEPAAVDLSAPERSENLVGERTTFQEMTVDEPVVERTTTIEKTEQWKAPVAQNNRSTRPRPTISRPTPSFVRPVLTLAAVVLLALLLGFGLRRNGKAAAQIPVPEQGTASASNVASNVAATFPVPLPNKSVQLPAHTGEENSNSAQAPSTATKAKATTAASPHKSQAAVSPKRNGELVAHDTVTYLDPRFKPLPKASKQVAGVHPISHKRGGGVVAANKVTYLDQIPAAKSPK